MRLATTSVVATGGAIDELGQSGTPKVVGKLTAAAICRNANFSAGMLDLMQETAGTSYRLHAVQVLALKAVALRRDDLVTCFSGKSGRDPSQHIVAVHPGQALQHRLGN